MASIKKGQRGNVTSSAQDDFGVRPDASKPRNKPDRDSSGIVSANHVGKFSDHHKKS